MGLAAERPVTVDDAAMIATCFPELRASCWPASAPSFADGARAA